MSTYFKCAFNGFSKADKGRFKRKEIKMKDVVFESQKACEREMIYQLVKTPAVTHLKGGKRGNVYSILALEKIGEDVESNFVYDVSRIEKNARELLERVKCARPELPLKGFLQDLI